MSDGIHNAYQSDDVPPGAVGRDPFDTGVSVPDTDITTVGHVYPPVVTAHFPSQEAAAAVVTLLRDARDSDEGIQYFEQSEDPRRARENDHELEPGEAALIIQVADEAEGREVVTLCEANEAIHARFYPEQRIGAARREGDA